MYNKLKKSAFTSYLADSMAYNYRKNRWVSIFYSVTCFTVSPLQTELCSVSVF